MLCADISLFEPKNTPLESTFIVWPKVVILTISKNERTSYLFIEWSLINYAERPGLMQVGSCSYVRS